MKGMKEMKVQNVQTLQQKLPEIRQVAQNFKGAEFKSEFMFQFTCEGGSKTLEIETASRLLELLLGWKFKSIAKFNNFCQEKNVKRLVLDQWMSLLDILLIIGDNWNQYDSDGAWPLIIDEFAEWMAAQK